MSDNEPKNDQEGTPAPEPPREPTPSPERPVTERKDTDFGEGERVIKLEPEEPWPPAPAPKQEKE